MERHFAKGSLSIQVSNIPPSASMRCVGVAELVGEEFPQFLGASGADGKCKPADSIVADPKAQSTADEGSDGE